MLYAVSIAVYFAVVFAMAMTWNMALFRGRYEALAGAFLREPPLLPAGMAAIAVQAVAMAVAFHVVYPRGELDLFRALAIAAVVNGGTIVYGAFVIPGKFAIGDVAGWASIELAYGVVTTVLIGLAMTATWWGLG